MRRLLTTGIKAILAIAALTTAAHWTMRLQREPTPQIATAPEIPGDPVSTGSIAPRQTEQPAPALARSEEAGLDQPHLAKLFSDAATAPKPAAKAVARR